MTSGDVCSELARCIVAAVPGAEVRASAGSPGHYSLEVASPALVGLSRIEGQRRVYGAIAHLMKGDGAPVHAVDTLRIVAELSRPGS